MRAGFFSQNSTKQQGDPKRQDVIQKQRKNPQSFLRAFLAFVLVFSLVPFQQKQAIADPVWDQSDFLITNNEIVGLSAGGSAKLAESAGILTIPAISGVTSIRSGFSGKADIKGLVVSEGYTSIGEGAFYDSALKSASLPNSLTFIGKGAFQNNALTAVSIPKNVSSLGVSAFASNNIVTLAIAGTALTSIPEAAFQDNALTSITLSNITSIGDRAFASNALTAIDAPEVATIGSRAFYNNALTNVSLPAFVAVIANDAFASNGRVVAVTTASSIVDSAFSGGSGHILNPVTIRVQYLNEEGAAIKGEETLGSDFTSDNLYSKGVEVTVSAPAVGSYVAIEPTSQTRIIAEDGETFVFTYRSVLGDVVISADNKIFEVGAVVDSAQIMSGVSATTSVDGSAVTDISFEILNEGASLPLVTFVPVVYNIMYSATDVYGNKASKTVKVEITNSKSEEQLDANWTYGDFTYEAGTLTGLSEKGNTKYSTNGITEVTLPDCNPYTGESIAKIAVDAFKNVNFTSIDFSKCATLTTIGNNAFSKAVLAELDLGNCTALTTIGNSAFKSAKLTELDLSSCTALVTIGSGSFENSQLTKLDLSNLSALKTIGDLAFYKSVLAELDLSDCVSLEVIDYYAFNDARLTELDLSNCPALTTIGFSAFRNSSLAKLDLSNCSALEKIGNNAFKNAQLIELDLSNCTSLANIEFNAFEYSPLTTLNMSKVSALKTIGSDAFYNAQLTELDLSGCTSLTTIGSSSFRNSPLIKLDLGNLSALNTIGSFAFRSAQLTELDLSDCTALTAIESNAFEKSPLATLDLSNCSLLATIGNSAFSGAQLTDLDLSSCTALKSIGQGAFKGASLTELDLSNNILLQTIGDYAFEESPMIKLDLSDCSGLVTIGDSAFKGAVFTELDLSDCTALKTIGSNAFYRAPLTALDLSDCSALASIGQSAFRQAKLTEIDFGECIDLAYIDQGAFYNSELTKLDLSNSKKLLSIGETAFYNSDLVFAVIGNIENSSGNIYNASSSSSNFCITNKNSKLPVYILDYDQSSATAIKDALGYRINPVEITVHYIDQTTGKPIDGYPPATKMYSWPLVDQTMIARTIFGYTSVNASEALPNIAAAPDPLDIQKGEIYFYYTPSDPIEYEEWKDFTITQTAPIDYNRIGDTLYTRVDLTQSNFGDKDAKGMQIKLYYDADRFDPEKVNVTSSQTGDYSYETSEPGVVTITVEKSSESGSINFSVPVFWYLMSEVTEEDKKFPISAELCTALDAGDQKAVGVGNVVYLSGYYGDPKYLLLADGNGDDREVYWGMYDLDTGRYYNDETAVSVTYQPVLNSLERNIEEITYRIDLPSYEYWSEAGKEWTTGQATFNKDKNPQWELSADGTYVTCTISNLNTVNPPRPSLVIDYPFVRPYSSVTVSSSYEATPYKAASSESVFVGTDDITNTFAGDYGDEGFNKIAGRHSSSAFFFDTPKGKARELSWTLTTGSTKPVKGGYIGDLVFEDKELDERLYYTSVELPNYLSGSTINGYNEDGTLVFSVADASGKVSFPSSASGGVTTNDIELIKIDASMLNANKLTGAYVIINTMLCDPDSVDYDDCITSNTFFFPNTGNMSATLYDAKGEKTSSVFGEKVAHWRIAKSEVDIKLTKAVVNKKSNYSSDDTVKYRLGFDYLSTELGEGVSAVDIDVEVTDFEFYDVVPEHMLVSSFTPSSGLVQGASSDLKCEVLGDYYTDPITNITHDVIRITASHVDLSYVDILGDIEASFDNTLAADAQLNNVAYANFGHSASATKVNFLNTTANANNPIEESGILFADAEVAVAAPTSFSAVKHVREAVGAENGSTLWGAWQRSVTTLPETEIQYRLLLKNSSQERSDIKIVDVLPIVGDTDIKSQSVSRGSQFENTLIGVTVPAGYTVSYLEGTGPLTYSDTDAYFDGAIWKPEGSVDFSKVRAIKIESESATKLAQNDSLEILVTMKAPAGYQNDGKHAVNSFVHKDNEIAKYTEVVPVDNEIYKPAMINLLKYDSLSGGSLLPDAVFGLYDSTGSTLLAVATTNAQGELSFEGLVRDNYILKELVAPGGYDLSTAEIKVSHSDFDDGGNVDQVYVATVKAQNSKTPVYGNVKIKKLDGQNPAQAIKGAGFALTSGANTHTAFTNENGEIVFSQVAVGTYTVSETTAPGNLQPVDDFDLKVEEDKNTLIGFPTGVSLDAGDNVTLNIINNKASISAYKLGIMDSTLFDAPEYSLDRNSGYPLKGVKLQAYEFGNSLLYIEGETDVNGKAILSGLKTNTVYRLAEDPLTRPKGWNIAEDVYFILDSTGKPSQVAVDGSGNILSQNEFSIGSVIVKDLPKAGEGTVTINKLDEKNNLLAGAVFAIEKETSPGSWTEVWTGTTDGSANLASSELSSGDYRVFEKSAPAGYVKSNKVEKFSIVDGAEDAVSFAFAFTNASVEPIIVKGDYVDTFSLNDPSDKLALDRAIDYLKTKYDPARVRVMYGANSKATLLIGLAGAEFMVAEYLGQSISGSPKATYTMTSGADGSFDLAAAGLVFKSGHSYTFTETTPPSGYQPVEGIMYTYQPDLEYQNIIDAGGMWIALENKVPEHKIIISKYASDTKAGLQGATFELLNPDASPVRDKHDAPMTANTNAQGFIEFVGLNPGTYYVHETSTANGYKLPEGYYKVEITGEFDASLANTPWSGTDVINDGLNAVYELEPTDGSATVVVYNTKEIDPQSLTIEKQVVGIDSPTDVFAFAIEFKAGEEYEPYVGPYTLFSSPEDQTGNSFVTTGEFNLGHEQRITIPALNVGDQYRVTELNTGLSETYEVSVGEEGYAPIDSSAYDGVIVAKDKVIFVNALKEKPIIPEKPVDPAKVDFQLVANKVLEGRDLSADEFNFAAELIAGDGSKLFGLSKNDTGDYVQNAKNAADGTVSFPALAAISSGTFVFELSEIRGFAEDIIYSEAKYYAEVVINEDSDTGDFSKAVTYYEEYDRTTGLAKVIADAAQVEFVNISTVILSPEDKGNLEVVKNVDKTEAKPGDELTYTITVRNRGTAELKGIEINDTLDSQVSFVSADNNGELVIVSGKEVVTWFISSLDAGQAIELKLVVKIKDDTGNDAVVANTASHSTSDDPEKKPTNTVKTGVETPPALAPEDNKGLSLAKMGDSAVWWLLIGCGILVGMAGSAMALRKRRRMKE